MKSTGSLPYTGRGTNQWEWRPGQAFVNAAGATILSKFGVVGNYPSADPVPSAFLDPTTRPSTSYAGGTLVEDGLPAADCLKVMFWLSKWSGSPETSTDPGTAETATAFLYLARHLRRATNYALCGQYIGKVVVTSNGALGVNGNLIPTNARACTIVVSEDLLPSPGIRLVGNKADGTPALLIDQLGSAALIVCPRGLSASCGLGINVTNV